MVRTNQGGSVLSFLIVGVIFVGLMLSGAYFVRLQTNQQTSNQPKPVVAQPEKTQPEPSLKQEGATEQASIKEESNAVPSNTTTLPQTGPVETMSVLVALMCLSIAGVSYVRSRRIHLPL